MKKIVVFSVLSAICLYQTAIFSNNAAQEGDGLGEDFNSELDKDLVVFEEEEEYEEPLEDE